MTDVSLLNENQKEAVLSDDKYLRIIAGAGSGKTRVLTMRIAHLIEDEDVRPWRILAITFTNKAANEMKERVLGMLETTGASPMISTIHSLCVRILREDIGALGYPRNFVIMDADDQKAVVKEACKELNIDLQKKSAGGYVDYISNNKTAEVTPEEAMTMAGSYNPDIARAKVYDYYVRRLKEMKALDFDDLILTVVRLFREFPEIQKKWQDRYDYILVDEFQDIDNIQYKLIRRLAGQDASVYVVGDPDQTIYTWRGADVGIIMNFEKDFPGTKSIVLNENYRSTQAILDGANSVIKNNRRRIDKELFTRRKSEEKITHYAADGDEYEAAWVAGKIQEEHAKKIKYHDIAVLYRSNYLSRSLEKALLDARIPYIIYGGIRFYERQEIKDALCYLRMAVTSDDLALERVISRPRRGIGSKTMNMIAAEARRQGITMYEVLCQDKIFSGRTQKTISGFCTMVENWRRRASENKEEIYLLFEDILRESGYMAMLEENKETERIENLKELTDDIRQFSENYPGSTLDEYLQLVSLYGDRDQTEDHDYVQLMTVHAAKGLEFDTVFVTDLNDGIFPNERAMAEGSRGVEEERRLAYVAFTRAKRKLYLCDAGGFSFILQKNRTRSRFINEIDDAYIEHKGASFEPSRKEVMLSEALFHDKDIPMAERLNKTKIPSLKKGEIVLHAKFGEGIVIRCSGGIAEIAFPLPYGVKKIAAGHPTLKRKAEQ